MPALAIPRCVATELFIPTEADAIRAEVDAEARRGGRPAVRYEVRAEALTGKEAA